MGAWLQTRLSGYALWILQISVIKLFIVLSTYSSLSHITGSWYLKAKVSRHTGAGFNCYSHVKCQGRCCAGSWSGWLHYIPSKFQSPKFTVSSWSKLLWLMMLIVAAMLNFTILQVFCNAQDKKMCWRYWQLH